LLAKRYAATSAQTHMMRNSHLTASPRVRGRASKPHRAALRIAAAHVAGDAIAANVARGELENVVIATAAPIERNAAALYVADVGVDEAAILERTLSIGARDLIAAVSR
jgi:hypothetical protein